jgi:hypothetical protein
LVPRTSTVTPVREVWRFLSVTVPVIEPVRCEKAAEKRDRSRKRVKIFFILGIADIKQRSN